MCENCFVSLERTVNKISYLLLWIFCVLLSRLQCYAMLNYQLPLKLMVVDGPFLLCRFVWILVFGSVQTVPLLQILWPRPWNSSGCCITHVWAHLIEAFSKLGLLFLLMGLENPSLCSMPLVFRGNMCCNKGSGSRISSCTPSLYLDVMHNNLRYELFVSLYIWWVLYGPPLGSWVPLPCLSQLHVYSIGIFRKCFGSVFWLFTFNLLFGCFFHNLIVFYHIGVGSIGIASTSLFFDSNVVINGALCVHNLACLVGPCLFYIPNWVILEHKCFRPSIW